MDDADWRPTCPLAALRKRAGMLAAIRRFFAERQVLEVETPALSSAAVTDPHLEAFTTGFRPPGATGSRPAYLQTSPEFAMKRLLAAGTGSIYQIAKAFRNAECGRHHNPEFTLLEWYRTGFSLFDLMDEIEDLFTTVGGQELALVAAERLTYRDVFLRHVGLDPLTAEPADFAARCRERGFAEADRLCGEDRATWLDLLFERWVQPHLGRGRLSLIHDYPAILPSLARHRPDDPRVVERVEVFLQGLELGNGFHELADAQEQEARFDRDLARRHRLNLPEVPKDRRLLAALRAGLPDCSGVAIGLDRLLMVLLKAASLDEVLAFPFGRA